LRKVLCEQSGGRNKKRASVYERVGGGKKKTIT